jgi:hypothetical protein
MLSIGLWRWYINITITILDNIRRPVFYLKLSSTLYVCPYLTGNTLRLRYGPNRLMLSIGLWRWYINIFVTTLAIIQRPGVSLRLQMEPTQLDPIDRGSLCLRRLDSVAVFRWNLLSWAQYTELFYVSGHRFLSPFSGGTYTVGPSCLCLYWGRLSWVRLKTETESSVQNLLF